MNIVINEWLQEAILEFLQERTRDRVSREHPEGRVCVSVEEATTSCVQIGWFVYISGEQLFGSEAFTPREALTLFLFPPSMPDALNALNRAEPGTPQVREVIHG